MKKPREMNRTAWLNLASLILQHVLFIVMALICAGGFLYQLAESLPDPPPADASAYYAHR